MASKMINKTQHTFNKSSYSIYRTKNNDYNKFFCFKEGFRLKM